MRHASDSEKTTIRLTQADRKILQRLTDLTGLKQSQVLRAALRVLLRRVERPVENDEMLELLSEILVHFVVARAGGIVRPINQHELGGLTPRNAIVAVVAASSDYRRRGLPASHAGRVRTQTVRGGKEALLRWPRFGNALASI